METKDTNTAPAVFNLDDTTPLETFDYTAKVPGTEDPTTWIVTFAGPAHPKTIKLNNDSSKKALRQKAAMDQARINGKKFKVDEKSPEDDRREFIEGVVARIVTWTPVTFGGKRYDFNDNDAVELLMHPALGAYVAQFVTVLLEEQTFTRASAKS